MQKQLKPTTHPSQINNLTNANSNSNMMNNTNTKHQQHQQPQLRLNIINKQIQDLRISIITSTTLTISHLKRKIETEFYELYSKELIVKVIEDENGFIISNNSSVGEHFSNGDTIFFQEHRDSDRKNFNMNLPNNLGEILSTLRFMTGSVVQKLDKIDINKHNAMELLPQLLHLGLWHTNEKIVEKSYKILNKMLGRENIEIFMNSASETDIKLFSYNYLFWFVEVPMAMITHYEVIWELMQLIEKMCTNEKFLKMAKASSAFNKVLKIISDLSKDLGANGNVGVVGSNSTPSQLKKLANNVMKSVNGGRNGGSLGGKVKSAYIPSMFANGSSSSSNVGSYNIEQILDVLKNGSPDDKLIGLQELVSTPEPITEASIRYEYYQKMIFALFSIRRLKNRKHLTFFNQALSRINAQTSKDHIFQIMQKDIMKRIHNFMLEAPVETHNLCIEYLKKLGRISTVGGVFNLERSYELLASPYPQFQGVVSQCIGKMSENISSSSVSALSFIPGIKDYIKICLKTNNQEISYNLLKTLANLCLDEQGRYQILNLKGIQIFIKFLQTSSSSQICRVAAKGLLNLTISSRENKVKVMGMMGSVLEKFYQGKYDSVASGYIETIIKSRNI